MRTADERRLELRHVRQRVRGGSELLGGRLRDGVPDRDEPLRHDLRGARRHVYVGRKRRMRDRGDDDVHRGQRGVLGRGADFRGVRGAGEWGVRRGGRVRLRGGDAQLQRELRVGHGGRVVRVGVYALRRADERHRDVRGWRVRERVSGGGGAVRRGVRGGRERRLELRHVRSGVRGGSELFGGCLRDGVPDRDEPLRHDLHGPGRRVYVRRKRRMRDRGHGRVHDGQRGVLGRAADVRAVRGSGERGVRRGGRVQLRHGDAPMRGELRVGHGGDVVRVGVYGVRGAHGRERDVRGWRVRERVSGGHERV